MRLYRDILKNAWHLSWRQKFLWFFGFFAALLGMGGNYETIIQIIDVTGNQKGFSLPVISFFWETGLVQAFSWPNIVSFISTETLNAVVFLLIAILLLAVVAFFLWLSTVSLGALIYGVHKIIQGEKCSFSESFHAGINNFWKLFIIYILTKISAIVLLFAVSIPLYLLMNNSSLIYLILYIILFVILAALVLIISFLAVYASIFTVVENYKIGASIKSAIRLFKNNWLISIETAILLLAVNIILGIIFALFTTLLSIPFSFLFMAAEYLSTEIIILGIMLLMSLIFFTAVIAFSAFISTFQLGSWVILFEKLKKGQESKLERMARSAYQFVKK